VTPSTTGPRVRTGPLVTVVVPCFDEAGFIDRLLEQMVPRVRSNDRWRIVLVDDGSTDATPEILARAEGERVSVLSGRWGSPGGTRSAGVAFALEADPAPDWLVTVDADVELTPEWLDTWDRTLREVDGDESIGAVNGGELQAHLYVDHPNAAVVSSAFGLGIGAGEGAAGVTNLNGVNHAVRTIAYLTAGPYLQPTAPGPHGELVLAGEDWDLGVRLRRAGFTVAETEAAVVDRGRRLLTDVHAYVSGEAYEGAFRRLAPRTDPSADIAADEIAPLVDGALERSLRHFLLKPILAEAVDLQRVTALSAATRAAMGEWMSRWPHPTIDESRNGFVFGRLARFAQRFTDDVRRDLGLDLDAVLDRLRTRH
jgi:glycosyltransferase involved in cell wall biosynthesis